MEYKAYALMAILLASVTAIGTAYAQTTPASVKTDKTNYNTGDQITVTGNLGQSLSPGQPVLIRVFGPTNNIVKIDQFAPNADGSFTYTFKSGGVMNKSGEHKVQITYGGVDKASTTFNFTAANQPTSGGGGGWKTTNLTIAGKTYPIQYMIVNGTLNKLTADPNNATLTAMISASKDGSLSLKIPREVMDSKDGGQDSDYVIFVDESEDFADDDFGASVRTVTIPFSAGAEQIDVVGTFMVPEFGAIAAIVLAIAIVGIIVATTKYSKFSFLPKI
jgi:predicted secreted protein with PEFG-CTERM motif